MTYRLTRLNPREYQSTAVEWARRENSRVVCLPTGTGKTLVGCIWGCDLLTNTAIERILILEPSRFLVEQIQSYYNDHTTIPTEKLYGATEPSERKQKWTNGVAVVTTPETAVNDISHLDFDAVVIDECHHTTGQHAFAKLIRQYDFTHRLGLSATIPRKKEREINSLIGEIRRWSWQDLPDEHVPDWFGEVYDAPYSGEYHAIKDWLENFRTTHEGTQEAGLASLGIRMLCRDGALALQETLERDTKMGEMMGEELLPMLQEADDLHKLAVCRDVLESHDFQKAVLFVDRVIVAQQLTDQLAEYDPVTLLGRLHSGHDSQEQAVAEAQKKDTDLIISTAAGEEGIDLPKADLLIVWSNVVNSVRFIQRLGRIMRKSDLDRPKPAVYIATPDSPDYQALREGIAQAKRSGLEIIGIDEEEILSKSIVTRVQKTLTNNPLQRQEIAQTLNQPVSKVDSWLDENIRAGDVFYLYAVPENLDEWRDAGLGELFGLNSDDMGDEVANNFSPATENRYYCRTDDISLVKADYPQLVNGTGVHHLQADFGPDWGNQSKYRRVGVASDIAQEMSETLADAGGNRFYANISCDSRRPTFTFQMTYHGAASEEIIRAVLRNADAIATTLNNRLS